MAPNAKGDSSNKRTQYKDKEKPSQIRYSNIIAAKGNFNSIMALNSNPIILIISCMVLAVSDAVRTSLGPRGMDKMV